MFQVRYFARQWGFAGDSLMDQLKVEMIADSIEDFMVKPSVPIRREKDAEKKVELQDKYREALDTFLGHLEKHLIANNGGNGWFVGDKITWADMLFACWCYWLPNGIQVTPPLDKFPKLKEHVKRTEAWPNIAKWMAERPVTEL